MRYKPAGQGVAFLQPPPFILIEITVDQENAVHLAAGPVVKCQMCLAFMFLCLLCCIYTVGSRKLYNQIAFSRFVEQYIFAGITAFSSVTHLLYSKEAVSVFCVFKPISHKPRCFLL